MPIIDRLIPYAEQLERLKSCVPNAFEEWMHVSEEGAKEYAGAPLSSLSLLNHPTAIAFHCYLSRYLKGDVLDIGCGPQKEPIYLQGHPYEHTFAIDPIEGDHPFHFVQSCAEYLPWADRQFDVLVVATSLDHVLLLDDALEEFSRVLKDDGRIVLWGSFIEGSKDYDPYFKDIKPVDPFHLFHFSREFFDRTMMRHFQMEHEYQLPKEYTSSFVTMEKKY